MSIIHIPKTLKDRLGEAATEALVNVLNLATERSEATLMAITENRFEKRLVEETAQLRHDMQVLRADIIRWMFLFWVGQLASMAALIKL